MAGRDVFRFETLLRLRRRREDQAQRVVATRLRLLDGLRRRAMTLQDHIAAQLASMRQALCEGRADLEELRWARHWLARLQRGLLVTGAETAANRAMLAQERSLLVAARIETRVLETLKERRLRGLREQADRREQIELDEVNVSRFACDASAEATT